MAKRNNGPATQFTNPRALIGGRAASLMLSIGIAASLGLMSAPAAQAGTPSLAATVNVWGTAQQIALTPNGTKAYVAASDRIFVFNTSNFAPSTVPFPPSASGANNVSMSPGGSKAFRSEERRVGKECRL